MVNWILFGVFLLIVAINAAVGAVRGLNKSVIRLMLVVVAVLLTFLIAAPVTSLIGNGIGQTISEELLEGMGSDDLTETLFDNVPLLQELISAVPAFVLGLVVFPLVFVVIKFLSWIAYHYAQKPLRKLIFKENRTKEEEKQLPKKTRLISLFSGLGIGVVIGMIVFGMAFTPLFGVISMLPSAEDMSSVIGNMERQDMIDKDDAATLEEVCCVTDNGLAHFYGFFGAKATGKAFLNAATRIEVDGMQTSLGKELENFLDMAHILLQNGLTKDWDDPDTIYDLLSDRDTMETLLKGFFDSETLRTTTPELLAVIMREFAVFMEMPADNTEAYDIMMEEVAQVIQNADSPFAPPADSISGVLNRYLAGDNPYFTDSVAEHIVSVILINGLSGDSISDADVKKMISTMDDSKVDSKLLAQLTNKKKFKTDIMTADELADSVRESLEAAISDEDETAETVSTLAVVLSNIADVFSKATDKEGYVDMARIDFSKVGKTVTQLQKSPLKNLGACMVDIFAAADPNGMFDNVISTIKQDYEDGKDISGTIAAVGAMASFGNAMFVENDQKVMEDTVEKLVENLDEHTISLLPDLFTDTYMESMGVPTTHTDSTYEVIETLMNELMDMKGAKDYENEVNAIVELNNLAANGVENFTEDNVEVLFECANESDAIYNTLTGISDSNPFGIEAQSGTVTYDLVEAVKDVYDESDRTYKDRQIATAIATLLGVENLLKLR